MNYLTLKKLNHISLILSKCFYKAGLNCIGRFISRRRVFSTFKVLEVCASDFLNKDYDFTNLKQIDPSTSPIFVMWLQGGEEVMPETVRTCFNSIKENCPGHPVNLVTEKNLSTYIELSPVIIQKYNEKKISRAFFSDIVRAALLYKYGGTWIDSTVYLSGKLSEEYFNKDFYSPCGFKGIKKRDWKYFFPDSQGWCTWFMGTNKIHYPLFDFLINFYVSYFEKYDYILDYFQADFSISLFARNNNRFHNYLKNRPINNSRAYELADYMNKKADTNLDKVKNLLNDNLIHKLTYKRNWCETNKKGEKSIYSLFLQGSF